MTFYCAPKLYSKIQNVARDMMASDFQPTAAQHEVSGQLSEELSAQQAKFDALIRGDVATFNDHVKSAGVPYVGSKPQ